MKILFAGDLFPTDENRELFIRGDTDSLFGSELIALFHGYDLTLANIEGTVTAGKTPIKKVGAAFRCDRECAKTFASLGLRAAALANNHIGDYGEPGVSDTIDALNKEGILTFGAGRSIQEAKRPLIFERDGYRLGIYACTEQEFSGAKKNRAGANEFDPLEISDEIAAIKSQVDYLAVLYHGGKEYYRYPAPYLQKRCRKMAEKGADLIICQHSHCVGSMERYEGAVICYGQGNFLLSRGDDEYRHTGLLVELLLPDRELRFLPVVKTGGGVRLADEAAKEEILAGFFDRSDEIKDPAFVEREYRRLAGEKLPVYYLWATGFLGSVLKRLHLTNAAGRLFSESARLRLMNMIRCEAHSDLIITGLSEETKDPPQRL